MGVAAKAGMSWLESQLSDGRQYLCGARFTLADIRLFVNYKFLTKVHPPMAAKPDEHPSFAAYIERIGAREATAAIAPPGKKK